MLGMYQAQWWHGKALIGQLQQLVGRCRNLRSCHALNAVCLIRHAPGQPMDPMQPTRRLCCALSGVDVVIYHR
jgi:hypothetical protein